MSAWKHDFKKFLTLKKKKKERKKKKHRLSEVKWLHVGEKCLNVLLIEAKRRNTLKLVRS